MRRKWPLTQLGEVLSERNEEPLPDDLFSGRVRIIEKISFNSGQIQLRIGGATKTGMILIQPGDLVVSGINAAKGAIAIYDEAAPAPVAATIHYGAYIPNKERVSIRFLWWMLRSRFFQELLLKYVPGGIKTELKAKRLLPVPVPLPPLVEQLRVVAQIEELAAQVNEALSLRLQAREDMERLLAACAKAKFTGAWPELRLEEFCTVITDGTHQTPRYADEGSMFLSAQNIKPFRFMPENHRKVSDDDFRDYTARNKPQKGDVLLTRVGAGIGEAAVVDQDIEFAIYVSIALIRTDRQRVLPEFLVHWLNSPMGRDYSRRETLGKSHSQGNLNLKLLRGFKVPVPSIPEQSRIVSELDAIRAQVDSIKQLQTETAVEFDALLPSVLDRAFKGEL